MNKRLKVSILYIILYLAITYSWRLYEIYKYGEPTPDYFHTLIATILCVSLTINVVLIRFLKESFRSRRENIDT